MVFELLDFSTWDPVTTGTTIFGIIGIAVAMFNGYQKSGLQGMYNAFVDGMTSSVPQTPEQTKAILAAPAETWKMDRPTYTELVKQLTESGAKFNERGLRAIVDEMESKAQVEYGIVVEDHDGNPATECKSAFISYGRFTLLSYSQVYITCNNAGGCLVAGLSA